VKGGSADISGRDMNLISFITPSLLQREQCECVFGVRMIVLQQPEILREMRRMLTSFMAFGKRKLIVVRPADDDFSSIHARLDFLYVSVYTRL